MSTKKKNQHYVWEHYLGAWATKKKVWCRRARGEPFCSSTSNVGQERYFYRLKEMTEQDLRFVEVTFINPLEPGLRDMARGWIAHFTSVFEIKRAYEAQHEKIPDMEAELDNAITNMEEDIHTSIEIAALSILDELRQGRASFTQDGDKLVAFMRFVAAQYMRTAKMQKAALIALRDAPANVEATWGLIRTVLSSTLGYGFFRRRERMRFAFLEAAATSEFVTGDQPIINVRGSEDDKPTDDVELYYPLSPSRAALIAFDSPHACAEHRQLTETEVAAFNERIAAESHEQLYAASKAVLEKLA